VLDERSLAIEAREVVERTVRGQHPAAALQVVIDAAQAANPTVTPEHVKAAIVSLLNRGILELTRDGRVKVRTAQ
jgi:hypothetical protein